MADFVTVARLDQLAPGHGMAVTVRGVPVAFFNIDGTVYAIDDTCPLRVCGVRDGRTPREHCAMSRPRLAVRCHHGPHGRRAGVRGHALPGAGGRGHDSGGREVNRRVTAAARVGQAPP
jgi:nitrite reductase/ring-hydroxylating ferredoxin subunit